MASAEIAKDDSELMVVQAHLLRHKLAEFRFATVLRNTIDQLLNGEDTGRYDWKYLRQTEKTHAGSLVEINLHREFDFNDGLAMDYQIDGIEVDCKFSQDFGGWMIPPEAMGHLCLLVWADDHASRWSAGLLRIKEEWLNQGANRDRKLTIKAGHRNKILWLWKDAKLPENVLLHLPQDVREQILLEGKRKGQARVIELFRRIQNKPISRGSIRTAAQQLDYMARLREGEGRARTVLREEGLLIVGPYRKHQDIARQVGACVPRRGEFVSFRVTELKPYHGNRPRVELDDRFWVLADETDQPEVAPRLPRVTAEAEL
ncbi:NaeI family type II restriction endonuclease [Streptomyces sp. NPDC056333]|uniref:NaeI family type II restriction endonuclease n=1 Tax=Streptomyces sp. NPDC056333 TaxID=3345786 RepID=UPI0035E026F8